MISFDFNTIKEIYDSYLIQPRVIEDQRMPVSIAPWDEILNPVEFRIYEDTRYIGLPLHPRFPVYDQTYLHFANPFKKIGIEILFKHSSPDIVYRKRRFLEAGGWMIHVVRSQNTYYTIEEYFRFKRKQRDMEFEDLTYEQRLRFAKKYKEKNVASLLHFLKLTEFSSLHEDSTEIEPGNPDP